MRLERQVDLVEAEHDHMELLKAIRDLIKEWALREYDRRSSREGSGEALDEGLGKLVRNVNHQPSRVNSAEILNERTKSENNSSKRERTGGQTLVRLHGLCCGRGKPGIPSSHVHTESRAMQNRRVEARQRLPPQDGASGPRRVHEQGADNTMDRVSSGTRRRTRRRGDEQYRGIQQGSGMDASRVVGLTRGSVAS